MSKEKKKKRSLSGLDLGLEVHRCDSCPGRTRLCVVDGRVGWFHRWVEEDRVLLNINTFLRLEEKEAVYKGFKETGVAPQGCEIHHQKTAGAIVEYEDGTVQVVDPAQVTFLDKKEGGGE